MDVIGYALAKKLYISGDSWNSKASMPTVRVGVGVSYANNKVYVFGGEDYYSSVNLTKNEEYNPSTNTWASKASMLYARESPAAATIGNKIYVIAGYVVNTGFVNYNEEYDTSTNTWTTKASSPLGGQYISITEIESIKKLYISDYSYFYSYDPTTNTWASVSSVPYSAYGKALATYNDKIYCFSGSSGTALYYYNYEYDYSTNTWTSKAAIPTMRYYAFAEAIYGNVTGICVIGGYNSDGALFINEIYNPLSNSWTSGSSFPVTVSKNMGSDSTMVGNKIYIISKSNDPTMNQEYNPKFIANINTLKSYFTKPVERAMVLNLKIVSSEIKGLKSLLAYLITKN